MRSLRERAGQVEQGGAGRRTYGHSTRPTTGQEHIGKKLSNLNLRGTEYSALIAAVLGWNSTTHY